MRAVAAFMLAAAAALTLSACKPAGSGASSEDMSMGDPNAKITMIEYASASCPHCARFNNDVFPQVKAKYIDTGQVHYVFREYLTPPAEVAVAGFLTARCAGKDKYFTVLDAIYRGQQAMFESGDFRGGLLNIAKSAGMSEKQWTDCVTDEKAIKALNDRVEKYASTDNITGTPTFDINGKRYDKGEMSMAEMDAAIAEAKSRLK